MSNTVKTRVASHQNKPRRYAAEVHLQDGCIEITSSRSHQRKIIIAPGSSSSPQGRLLRVRGVSFSMNSALRFRFGGNWDPVTLCWTIPAAKGIALRAYLCEHF